MNIRPGTIIYNFAEKSPIVAVPRSCKYWLFLKLPEKVGRGKCGLCTCQWGGLFNIFNILWEAPELMRRQSCGG